MEYKTVVTEIKATKEPGFEGYFSIFGNIDDGGDVSEKGSFKKTLKERGNRVQVFFAHNWDRIIGPPPKELFEDNNGLFAKGKLTTDSFWGNEAWALIKDQALNEGSYGYDVIQKSYETNPETGQSIRRLKEQKLYEISPVPLGMNPLTSIGAAKCGLISPNDFAGSINAILDEVKNGRSLVTASAEKKRSIIDDMDALLDLLRKSIVDEEKQDDGDMDRPVSVNDALRQKTRLRLLKLERSYNALT